MDADEKKEARGIQKVKVLKCPKCNRIQNAGDYCLDCGSKLEEIITSDIKFNPIKSSRTADQLKRDIRRWLERLGVQQPDIKIRTANERAEVEYVLNKNIYSFSSTMQESLTNNLAAVEQFLHYRVLGIERGIETTEQAFAGYMALPDPSTAKDPYEVLGFKGRVSLEEAKAKFKQLAKLHHPDKEGNKETFQKLAEAIRKIEEEQK